jgi:hypothetical protein
VAFKLHTGSSITIKEDLSYKRSRDKLQIWSLVDNGFVVAASRIAALTLLRTSTINGGKRMVEANVVAGPWIFRFRCETCNLICRFDNVIFDIKFPWVEAGMNWTIGSMVFTCFN